MSMSRAERRVAKKIARRDAAKSGVSGADPKTRFAKRIAVALAEFGASGAEPDAAVVELLTFSAEFAAFHGISEEDFAEQARHLHSDAVERLAEIRASKESPA